MQRRDSTASNDAGAARSRGVIPVPSLSTDLAMKLYYSPGACSLSPHIVLREAGLAFEPVLASTKTPQAAGRHRLLHDQSEGLRAAARARQRRAPERGAGDRPVHRRPGAGEEARAARTARWRATGCRSGSTSRPARSTRATARCSTRRRPRSTRPWSAPSCTDRYRYVDSQLEGKSYLMGSDFSVADAYLFTVTNWAKHVGLDTRGVQEPRCVHGAHGGAAGSAGGDEGRRAAQVSAMRAPAASSPDRRGRWACGGRGTAGADAGAGRPLRRAAVRRDPCRRSRRPAAPAEVAGRRPAPERPRRRHRLSARAAQRRARRRDDAGRGCRSTNSAPPTQWVGDYAALQRRGQERALRGSPRRAPDAPPSGQPAAPSA